MPEAARSALKRCTATRKDGSPCTGPAFGPGDRCYAHDPARAGEREAARRKGGAHTGRAARLGRLLPPRLIPVFDRLERALVETHDGSLEPRTASAMAALAGALCKVLQVGELEERLRSLEARMGNNHTNGGSAR